MSCRLLNQIFRVTQTAHLHPVLYKIMLNALPNNNSLLKNTTTSFYTILTSNLYKNHNLAKQKNALQSSDRLVSDQVINCSKQVVKKVKACPNKPPKKKTSKLKYAEIRVCQSDDKCKEKMICICMPISKFKAMRNEEELRKNAEFQKLQTVICAKPSQAFCWIPPQKKPCPVQTWILSGTTKCVLPYFTKNKKATANAIDRKPLQSNCLLKPRSSTNNYAPCKKPSAMQQKQLVKNAGSSFNCAPNQSKQQKVNMCPPKVTGLVNASPKPSITNKLPKQQASSSVSAPPKQPNKTLKN